MINISIAYNEECPDHRDMLLATPEIELEIIADSYYFVLDQRFLPEEETFEKALIIFKGLLTQWMLAVRTMQSGQISYLPFDFSDQSVGGLEVRKEDEKLSIKFFDQGDQYVDAKLLPKGYLILYPSISYEGMIFDDSASDLWYRPGELVISTEQFIAEIEREKSKIPLSRYSANLD